MHKNSLENRRNFVVNCQIILIDENQNLLKEREMGLGIDLGIGDKFREVVGGVRDAANTVEQKVETVVETVTPSVDGANAALQSVASRFSGVADVTQNLTSPIDLPIPNPIEEGKKLVETAGRGIGFLNDVADFGRRAVGFVDGAIDRGRQILEPVGNFLNEAGRRIGDGLRGIGDGVVSAFVGVGRNVIEGGGDILSGLAKPFTGNYLDNILRGDFKGALSEFGQNLVDGAKQFGTGLLKTFVQTPVDAVITVGGRVIGALQTLVGLEPVGRELTPAEISELQKVYGDTVDFSNVRIKEGNIGLFGLGGAPFTHGDTIYIPNGYLPDPSDPNYAQARRELLVHEMGHVWQHQNGGTDYMSESLLNQLLGNIQTGSRNGAYDFERGIKEGKSWAELNPEQQAHLIEDAYAQGLFDDPNARFVYNGNDYTDYARTAMNEMRAGKGAP